MYIREPKTEIIMLVPEREQNKNERYGSIIAPDLFYFLIINATHVRDIINAT